MTVELFKRSSRSEALSGLTCLRLADEQDFTRIFDARSILGSPKRCTTPINAAFCRPAKEAACLPLQSRSFNLTRQCRIPLQDCVESIPHQR
ncbi:hypothetical protein QEH52_19475 [Coraliomargarita sp. SDUM461003]|uniref:Uncharacterized protein n=1 Tax=Thalassobacterium maritimum TaxID=3041265 RepID=A0ABU1AZX0_9BACT|nr:hypothetical protein [Coraliomargarita sp. SDUM461003]MDQ8209708.1 hypothetical protein [Coraliomargarita sp. SDUM461003]